jgi:hypothetical protein
LATDWPWIVSRLLMANGTLSRWFLDDRQEASDALLRVLDALGAEFLARLAVQTLRIGLLGALERGRAPLSFRWLGGSGPRQHHQGGNGRPCRLAQHPHSQEANMVLRYGTIKRAKPLTPPLTRCASGCGVGGGCGWCGDIFERSAHFIGYRPASNRQCGFDLPDWISTAILRIQSLVKLSTSLSVIRRMSNHVSKRFMTGSAFCELQALSRMVLAWLEEISVAL